MQNLIQKPWSVTPEDATGQSYVDKTRGISDEEAISRRIAFGENKLTQKEKHGAMAILIRQFKSLIVVLLAAAALAAFLFGEYLDGGAIVVVIFLNAAIGFTTELRAIRSMEALEKLNEITARVLRDGGVSEVDASELVPGDIIILEGGDLITADCRLIEASKLQANESALTGESMPVDKQVESVAGEAILAERPSMLFKGTEVVRGSAVALVTATGMKTEIGEISALVSEAKDETTPLEADLDKLGNKLIFVVIAVAAAIALAGIASGRELLLMIETSIALAVAAIPEGLPIVATIALARGMWRMSKRNALVNHLSAVETLGSTSVICTDKTGTLTEGAMDVYGVEGWGGSETIDILKSELGKDILRVAVLCNNAFLDEPVEKGEKNDDNGATDGDEPRGTGDPLEVALLATAKKVGIDRSDLVREAPEIREEAFDSDIKMMATYHRRENEIYVAVKGAPEAVLAACTLYRDDRDICELDDVTKRAWEERNIGLAGDGFRILAVAEKSVQDATDAPYENLSLLGYIVFRDPPRAEVATSIAACRNAGIQVVMITGDQAATARTIARDVGLDDEPVNVIEGYTWNDPDELEATRREEILNARVFSRFSPRQKMDLIEMHQQNDAVVAMTGDGVNDAPALKKADIGVAMGIRGTQVAREAADMVLKDDRFSTIVEAVKQGRIIFDNIRSFVTYLLSCNMSEILVLSFASFLPIPLPILPLQILFLNLVTDIFPALALGVGEGDDRVLNRPVREKKESIMDRRRWTIVFGYGLVMAISVLAALFVSSRVLGFDDKTSVTVSFLTLAFAQLWHVLNMRASGSKPFRNEVTKNPFVWAAVILCGGLTVLAVYIPILADVLNLVHPGVVGWAIAIGFSLVPVIAGLVRQAFGSR